MAWFMIVVNGHPFGVYAPNQDRAIRTGTVHLAFLHGCLTIGPTVQVCRWDD